MKLTIHGCRGSIAVSSKDTVKYGGYTSCYEVRADNTQIVLDAGTGFRNVNLQKDSKKVILFSHLHHDHIQGLGFNKDIFNPSCQIEISSALCEATELRDNIQTYYSGSYFPLDLTDRLQNLKFHNFSTLNKNNITQLKIISINKFKLLMEAKNTILMQIMPNNAKHASPSDVIIQPNNRMD